MVWLKRRIISVQFSQSHLTLCNPMDSSTPGFPGHHQLPELTQTHVHWVGDAIQPSQPLPSPSPPALNLSQHQGLFQLVSSSHQVPKYWSFSFSISPSNEYSGLISFRMDWLDLLAVQVTMKSLLQHPSSKASILRLLFTCYYYYYYWVASVMSNSVWPHGLLPTRLLHPWDSPGKNTGVDCHLIFKVLETG